MIFNAGRTGGIMKRLVSAVLVCGMAMGSLGMRFVSADEGGSGQPGGEHRGGRFKQACDGDIDQFCKDVKPGGGRIIQCLKQNMDSLSSDCSTAMKRMANRPKKHENKNADQSGDKTQSSGDSQAAPTPPSVQDNTKPQ
jgi:hypothetical protein